MAFNEPRLVWTMPILLIPAAVGYPTRNLVYTKIQKLLFASDFFET
jgi:hypothetical protein